MSGSLHTVDSRFIPAEVKYSKSACSVKNIYVFLNYIRIDKIRFFEKFPDFKRKINFSDESHFHLGLPELTLIDVNEVNFQQYDSTYKKLKVKVKKVY